MIAEFKKFIARGSVLDMAVGIIIGAAFTTVVRSLVDDIIMPPIGRITGGIDFNNLFIDLSGGAYATLEEAEAAGAATINYGLFVSATINFLIVALAVFFLVRGYNRIVERGPKGEEPATAPSLCPHCRFEIPAEATRCGHCTSSLVSQSA